MKDFNSIDWQKLWLKLKKQHNKHTSGAKDWNKRAPVFAANNKKSRYADALIKAIKPERSWSVLDMGSGAGTLAIPMSKLVKNITAVDFSDTMIELLDSEIKKQKIRNIKTICASWEDDWEKSGIGKYDVAIASRSIAVDDLKNAVLKLDNAALKRVYITTVAGDGPRDRKAFEAVGRKFNQPVDYIYVYNLLYQLNIKASVEFIYDKYDNIFKDHQSAVNSFKWMFDNITLEEQKKLEEFVAKHLVSHKGKFMLDYERAVKWAVIRWDKEN